MTPYPHLWLSLIWIWEGHSFIVYLCQYSVRCVTFFTTSGNGALGQWRDEVKLFVVFIFLLLFCSGRVMCDLVVYILEKSEWPPSPLFHHYCICCTIHFHCNFFSCSSIVDEKSHFIGVKILTNTWMNLSFICRNCKYSFVSQKLDR